LRQYKAVVNAFYPQDDRTTIPKDLLQAIRYIHYVISDRHLFGRPPRDEKDVHLRIEGILKCFYPDLKHKPTLNKPIKSFEPDTGIPSIGTLLEYKFIGNKKEVPQVADQILADTRGYTSKDWQSFIYVIYETNRFQSEKDWNELLRQSDVPENTFVVVLSGEPSFRRKRGKLPASPKGSAHKRKSGRERASV
jgi:hypothetical protein